MRKLIIIDALAILLLLAGCLSTSGPIVLNSEITFDTELGNSLYYLDEAKSAWEEKEHKVDGDTPSMEQLLPYLGEHKYLINRCASVGIRYIITPINDEHHQNDIATLTKDIRFTGGFSRFYSAGTTVSTVGAEWTIPPGRAAYRMLQQEWAIFFLLWNLTFFLGNAVFLVIWICRRARRTSVPALNE